MTTKRTSRNETDGIPADQRFSTPTRESCCCGSPDCDTCVSAHYQEHHQVLRETVERTENGRIYRVLWLLLAIALLFPPSVASQVRDVRVTRTVGGIALVSRAPMTEPNVKCTVLDPLPISAQPEKPPETPPQETTAVSLASLGVVPSVQNPFTVPFEKRALLAASTTKATDGVSPKDFKIFGIAAFIFFLLVLLIGIGIAKTRKQPAAPQPRAPQPGERPGLEDFYNGTVTIDQATYKELLAEEERKQEAVKALYKTKRTILDVEAKVDRDEVGRNRLQIEEEQQLEKSVIKHKLKKWRCEGEAAELAIKNGDLAEQLSRKRALDALADEKDFEKQVREILAQVDEHMIATKARVVALEEAYSRDRRNIERQEQLDDQKNELRAQELKRDTAKVKAEQRATTAPPRARKKPPKPPSKGEKVKKELTEEFEPVRAAMAWEAEQIEKVRRDPDIPEHAKAEIVDTVSDMALAKAKNLNSKGEN